jgi:hypothetical protein
MRRDFIPLLSPVAVFGAKQILTKRYQVWSGSMRGDGSTARQALSKWQQRLSDPEAIAHPGKRAGTTPGKSRLSFAPGTDEAYRLRQRAIDTWQARSGTLGGLLFIRSEFESKLLAESFRQPFDG